MDRSNDGAYGRTQNVSTGRAPEGRPSVEARSPQTPPRLQKKRSRAGPHGAAQPQVASGAAPTHVEARDSTGTGEGGKGRKGSLRNAMRRIFGRRSREAEAQPSQISPPRHGYHRSEPTGLPPQPEVPESLEIHLRARPGQACAPVEARRESLEVQMT